eukprot:TRINITY_DN6046_c0_g1_i1.p1 TRINITY_DN6046_c0_g1~~TRINITY_DN6046_c0_g1_i1.p1  ORF type:complete len:294 (+),score=66.88 TRINITY_DN6046_c0_g1_i1:1340-2221(+)
MAGIALLPPTRKSVSSDYAKFTNLRVDFSSDRQIAEVVLNRPKKLNTMTKTFFEEVGEAFRMLDVDEEVRAVLLWAEGRLFTAGLDLKEAFGSSSLSSDDKPPASANLQLYKHVKEWQRYFENIRLCRKPVIAAVHGKCIGGGIDLTSPCDFRVCTSDAAFVVKETAVGIVADLGTLQRIARIIGPGPAREMVFTANTIDSQRALEWKYVNRVFETKEDMLGGARELARTIANNSPLVVQAAKRVMNYAEGHTIEEGLDHVALWNSAFLQSEDLMEAFFAFMQKRKPKYKSRL